MTAITSYTSKLLNEQNLRNIFLRPSATKALAPNNVHKPTLQPLPKTPAQALLPSGFFSEAIFKTMAGAAAQKRGGSVGTQESPQLHTAALSVSPCSHLP